ncbi:MAG: NADP-dependent malic enzyme [Deltaproteobacteria bacterium]|nr:NADP-dependent malic enzyme [Deltaproteobacteria bacterium]
MDYEKLALEYHEYPSAGKLSVQPKKQLNSQYDLSLAYTPGVAGPCRKIHKSEDNSFRYTIRSNLVGVITNGTAVLGLGDIGPYAAKPVMEGKAVLFKKFADIDVFDLEIASKDPDEFITIVSSLEPTFGGINLEDIKAPECFYIEEKLREKMSIPVFHDDQHGTAIIAAAAFINACEISGRSIEDARVVFSGAGAAAIGCASLFRKIGIKNIIMCDSQGVIHTGRSDLNEYKKRFAIESRSLKTLEDALEGADVFIGVSTSNILTPKMLKKMANQPIVFALSNPNPEIDPQLARDTRKDIILATGRSDYPNQVNNVLGFPYIFRGALDVRAKGVSDEMSIAAAKAISELAKESVPEEVLAQYKQTSRYIFGKDYLIPKPVDQRVLLRVAPAVAQAAMETGMARLQVDIEEYKEQIEKILGPSRRLMRRLRKEITYKTVEKQKPRVVIPFGAYPKILSAAKQVADDGEIQICLLGREKEIQKSADRLGIKSLSGIEIVDPMKDQRRGRYTEVLYELRKRKGVSRTMSDILITNHNYFAAVMLQMGDADAMVNGVTSAYVDAVRPILEIIGAEKGATLAGVYIVVKEQSLLFLADCTINVDPSAEELANIALASAKLAEEYTQEPKRVAMLSYASFGTSKHAEATKVAKAVSLVRERNPALEMDGEMQVEVALNQHLREKEFPFTNLKGNANILIFPNLGAANISYKLLQHVGGAEVTGPILVGLNKPANSLQREASVQEITSLINITAHKAVKTERFLK